MAIVEYLGGRLTHRYLMKKSKDELASRVMNMLTDLEIFAKDCQKRHNTLGYPECHCDMCRIARKWLD